MTPPGTCALPRAITRHKTPNSLRAVSLGDEIIRRATGPSAQPAREREIYIYGERVKDVTTHPAFRNSARMVGNAGTTPFTKSATKSRRRRTPAQEAIPIPSLSARRLRRPHQGAQRHRHAATHLVRLDGPLARLQGGVPGHAGRERRFYGQYAGNARACYSKSQERLHYWNHAIVNPPIDRDRPIETSATSSCTSTRKPTRA